MVTSGGSVPAPPEGERVVVGVDGSAGSAAALRWALREAKLRGVQVHAVHAWEFHPSWADPGLGSMFPVGFAPGAGNVVGMPAELASDTGVSTGELGAAGLVPGGWADAQAAIANELDTAVAGAVTAEHDSSGTATATVKQVLVEGHGAQALLDYVAETDLLVVGTRGHGELAGTLLGSISQHLVAHASCPVVVVPHDRHRENESARAEPTARLP